MIRFSATEMPKTSFPAVVRLNSPVELEYYQHGGILQRVLRQFLRGGLGT